MKILVLARTTFNVTEYTYIKSIVFDGTNYTLTLADNTTVSYAKADYLISMKW